MAKQVFSTTSTSFTATADTTSLAGVTLGLQGQSSTTQLNVLEISVSGQASASTLANGVFARNSTACITPTALGTVFSCGPMYPNTYTAAFTGMYTTGATPSQRSSANNLARLNLSLNGFGGIYRWVAAPGEEWNIYGTANSFDSGFSLTTAGSGATCALGVHIVFEPL